MTIEDPVALAEPWVIELSYVRNTGLDRLIHDDYAYDRGEVGGDAFTIVLPRKLKILQARRGAER